MDQEERYDGEAEQAGEQSADEQGGRKLVPVMESIRYRRRAQSAEKKAQVLAEELAEARSRASELAERLEQAQLEQQLMRRLSAAGAVDLEAAVLMAKSRIEAGDEADVEAVVARLKKEKGYLFGGAGGAVGFPRKTAGAREKLSHRQAELESAAKKAAATGSRADLQQYLRMRRQMV